MFEKSLLAVGGTRRQWTGTAFALLGETVLVGILMAIPLICVQTMPSPQFTSPLVLTLPPLPPPPPVIARRATPPRRVIQMSAVKTVPRKFQIPESIPSSIPSTAPLIAAASPALSEVAVAEGVPGVSSGQQGGVIGGIVGASGPPAPAPKQIARAEPATPQRIEVGGDVEAARLTHEVRPEYPIIAREARIYGTVQMKAIIGQNGSVEQLNVISGHPLLVPAALNAVKQWVYQPAYLNGNPVEVATEIDVHFTLS